jgi:FkbM family methyltransferase
VTRKVSLALALALLPLGAAACATAPAAEWREQRTARLEQGLAAQQQQFARLRHLDERYTTGGKRPERQLMLDAVGSCVTEERIGSLGDGGKWICNSFRLPKDCVVYGVGGNDDISFEEQMAERFGCDVHVFDPSPVSQRAFGALQAGKALGKGRLTYHPWGLGPVSKTPGKEMDLGIDGAKCEVKTLAQMAEALGHQRIDVFKMDIEGGEFAVLEDLHRTGLLKKLGVRQLQIEFHAIEMPGFDALVNEIEALRGEGFLLFRKEINPYAPHCCSEFAFAEKSFLLD